MSASPADLAAQATSEREFLTVLQHLLQRSGRTAGYIARIAGIPRSTAYHFVSARNSALPTNREHLEQFVRACKTEPRDLEQVMGAWERLSTVYAPAALRGHHDSTRHAVGPELAGGDSAPFDHPGRSHRGRIDYPQGPGAATRGIDQWPDTASSDKEVSSAFGADARYQLRGVLRGIGLREDELLEPLVTELLARGCRPRKAWRLANELTQEEVAEQFNRLTEKPNAPMKASRISEFESWPGPRAYGRSRPRPTIRVLRILALIYGTSWEQLVDASDLLVMPPPDTAQYKDAIVHRSATQRPATSRGGLPAETTAFVGRIEQLAELRRRVHEHLSSGRPSTHVVSGLAGVGKTALARQVVRDHADRYRDGVIWENMDGHSAGRAPRAAADVLEQLLLRIGVPPELIEADVAGRAERWRFEMRERRLLIVFDNVLDSKQIRDLLPHAPGCFVLITSRHKLTGLVGAAPLQLDAMTPTEAEELLVTLSHLPPGYDTDAVHRILQTAGRLPLALRLIAGQLAHGGPEMLAAADRDFQQLTAGLKGAPDAEESQAADILDRFSAEGETLRAAFELSYQRLPDPELRRVARLLGWFPSEEITAETLAVAADLSPEVARPLIRGLFEAGFLEPTSDGTGRRYRIHDVTRLFARAQASNEDLPGERVAAIDRLTHHSLRIAERAGVPEPFGMAGSFPNPPRPEPSEETTQAREWLTREREMLLGCVRSAARNTQAGQLARLLAFHLVGAGRWSDVRWLYLRALEIARSDGDRAMECDVLFGLGAVYRHAFDYENAANCFKEARDNASEAGDELRRTSALWGYAETTRLIGNFGPARTAYEEVLTIARKLGVLKLEGDALRGLGHTAKMTDNTMSARELYEQARAIATRCGDRSGVGWALLGIGGIDCVLDQFDAARATLEEAGGIALELGDDRLYADVLRGKGRICQDLGNPEYAQGHYSDSLQVARRSGDPHGEADAWRALGGIAAASGKYQRACEFLQKSLALYQAMGVKLAAAQVSSEIAALQDLTW